MTLANIQNPATAIDFDQFNAIVDEFAGWTTVSTHRTSEGTLRYMCNALGEWQIVVRPN